MTSGSKGQLETEFIILLIMGFFILFTILAVLMSVSNSKRSEQFYYEINDLGKSVQQELLLASQVHDGYTRNFTIPRKLSSRTFNIHTGSSSKAESHIIFAHDNQEIFFMIPKIHGTITTGTNTVTKRNGTLYVT
ncbi:MAG: hypothetical protein ACLFTH_00970 [Candidatus Woesearchaeota archaeon]